VILVFAAVVWLEDVAAAAAAALVAFAIAGRIFAVTTLAWMISIFLVAAVLPTIGVADAIPWSVASRATARWTTVWPGPEEEEGDRVAAVDPGTRPGSEAVAPGARVEAWIRATRPCCDEAVPAARGEDPENSLAAPVVLRFVRVGERIP